MPAWGGADCPDHREPVWYEREADLQQQVQSRKNPAASHTVPGLDGAGILRVYAGISKNRDSDKAHGFRPRSWRPPHELVRLAQNAAFRDHWGSEPPG
ncbi:hypothetical protein ABIB27_001580 [Arthrobacter sp. UYEF21]